MKNYDLAQQILSHYFISPEEVIESCEGVIYTKEQLARFIETIPGQEVLEWCRDNNYILVPGPNCLMSLLDIYKTKKDSFYPGEFKQYANQKFSLNDKVETKWYMIHNDIHFKTNLKSWDEQQTFLSDIKEVPNAAEFAWAWIIFTAARYVRLQGAIQFRTSSLDLNGNHVIVGWSGSGPQYGGLTIVNHLDSHRAHNFALAISRK